MAKDNDQFMKLRSEAIKPLCVYAGTPIKIGPGWIPDYIEVNVDPSLATCQLTLIELEATEINARASCRKYLPESSAEIANLLVLR
jgi:hypothetical protein